MWRTQVYGCDSKSTLRTALRGLMTHVVCGGLFDDRFADRYAEKMYRLRYRIFHERLRWQVQVVDGMEFDEFDDYDSIYLLTTPDEVHVSGGWRLRPTTRRYMLGDVFSELLAGAQVPREERVWEISRFAVDPADANRPNFGFGDISRKLVIETVRFAATHHINQYVMVVSVAVERLLCSFGLKLHRFAPPKRLGRVLSVAVWLDIDAHTRHVALGEPLTLLAAA